MDARRILASLEELSSDSGVRGRVLRQLVATEPFRQVMDVWRPTGPLNASPARLTEIRDAILNSYVAAGDVPVTNSELDCAMGRAPAAAVCERLPREITEKGNDPFHRYQMYYEIYRERALAGEPNAADARRYLAFLTELPYRIELYFVRYHALNLMRDSETLAGVDDQDRLGFLDTSQLISGNRRVIEQGLKFAHLDFIRLKPEGSLRPRGWVPVQANLSHYLRSESRRLSESVLSKTAFRQSRFGQAVTGRGHLRPSG